ncbi:MAG: metalloregulator ArsR/SmtB family transcription factor, partial [Mailhella sp.]|nr:metalloregulator ArsR/SmtB family transcription factor [Mailhella sp.]
METLRYLKALADETRLRLAVVLYHYELSVNELVALLGMGQSRISRHLKILTEAGLLRPRRD